MGVKKLVSVKKLYSKPKMVSIKAKNQGKRSSAISNNCDINKMSFMLNVPCKLYVSKT